jgi:hypothetical protein
MLTAVDPPHSDPFQALEITKFLLALEPEEDPLAATLLIDYHALRAAEFSWLARMADEWEADHQLSWLPNMVYVAPPPLLNHFVIIILWLHSVLFVAPTRFSCAKATHDVDTSDTCGSPFACTLSHSTSSYSSYSCSRARSHSLTNTHDLRYSVAYARRQLALASGTSGTKLGTASDADGAAGAPPAGNAAALAAADDDLVRAITRFPAVVTLMADR